VRLELSDVLLVEYDASGAELQESGDQIDDRGLARAIRADEPRDPPGGTAMDKSLTACTPKK
jgi:hypothetical protein